MASLLNFLRLRAEDPARKMGEHGRREVSLKLASPGTPYVASGLAVATAKVGPADWTGPPAEAVLELALGGAPVFRKAVELRGERLRLSFPVHSHLLPNGTMRAKLTLLGPAGERLGQDVAELRVNNQGPLAEAVRASLVRSATPLVLDGSCDSSSYDYADGSLAPWFDRADAREEVRDKVARGEISPDEGAWLNSFVADGFLVADGMIEPELLIQIRAELDDAAAKKVQGYEWGSSQRINNLHLAYPGVRALWQHPGVMRLLRLIFEAEPRPCQTLTFLFGSQQDLHQDTIHLTPFPAGYMCGVWIAIDDVLPDSGELEVLRGSHRLSRTYLRDLGCAKVREDQWTDFGERMGRRLQNLRASGSFEPIAYRPKAGQVLIWHENLMHGGSRRLDENLSRRSIVSHYFADGALAYYDSTGLVGTMARIDKAAT